jgi:TMEM175 potassium channel family protein
LRDRKAPKVAPSTSGRLSGYTDAVFAVIITIMVLELRPPASATVAALLELWPSMVSYIGSYIFVAIIWINHHYLMGYIRVPSLRILWFNFGHLFFVSLVPFATAWMASSELARTPVIIYAALFVATDGMYNLFEAEIIRHSGQFTEPEYRRMRRRSLLPLSLFITAALLAIANRWLGFGGIRAALALHLRPDVSNRKQRLHP